MPNDAYEHAKRESRMRKIREMRYEMRRLEMALQHIEHLVGTPTTQLQELRNAALPLRGWAASIVESYVVLEHVLSTEIDASIATGKLKDLIQRTADRYAPAVIERDPARYPDPWDPPMYQ